MRPTTFRTLGMALAAGTLALTGCKKGPPAPVEIVKGPTVDAPGCDVARVYVAGRLGRVADKTSIVVDAAAPNTAFVPNLKPADLVRKYDPGQENPAGWPKDPPSAAMVGAWQGATQASPFTVCVDFPKVVETAGVTMGAVKVGEKPAKDKPERTQMNFTVPVVSADGAEAMLLETGRTGGGSQASIAVHLRKGKDGAWAEADSLVLALN
jgi:hypothetical protein